MRMLRANRNFMNRSENACSSCMTRIISSRVILSAVQAVIAVAEARRSPGNAASASSPTKSRSGEERDGGFLAGFRNDCEFCAALLKIEDGIRGISLRKEGLFSFNLNNSSTKSCAGQKGRRIEHKGNSKSHPGPPFGTGTSHADRVGNVPGTRLNSCQRRLPRMAGVNCPDYRPYVA